MNGTTSKNKRYLLNVILALWLGQLVWLAWHFSPEAADISCRVATCRVGEAVRQEESYYQWLEKIKSLVPPSSIYIFVDCYEAGKDIVARYVLYPRRIITMNPMAAPSFLFEEIRKEGAEYLILRECNLYPHWQFLFQPDNPVFHQLAIPGSGMVFKIDLQELTGGFYD